MLNFLFRPRFGVPPIIILMFIISGVFFHFNGNLDITISKKFFEKSFTYNNHPFSMFIYDGVHIATTIMVIGFIIFLVVAVVTKRKKPLGVSRKTVLYLLLVMALGPGLVVNGIFKANFNRPRPSSITEFNGSREFAPAFSISNQPGSNYSFPSGHASFGYFFTTFAFLASTANRRKIWLAISVTTGLVIGFVRIAQGGHFFSDIILAFFFIYIVAGLTHYILYDKLKKYE